MDSPITVSRNSYGRKEPPRLQNRRFFGHPTRFLRMPNINFMFNNPLDPESEIQPTINPMQDFSSLLLPVYFSRLRISGHEFIHGILTNNFLHKAMNSFTTLRDQERFNLQPPIPSHQPASTDFASQAMNLFMAFRHKNRINLQPPIPSHQPASTDFPYQAMNLFMAFRHKNRFIHQ